MIRLLIIPFLFLVLLIPPVTFAEENTDIDKSSVKQLFEAHMAPVRDSPYTMEMIAITKNPHGELVSVIYADVYGFLPHPILDDYLNKFPSKYITKDGIKHKQWTVWILKTHEEEKPIHGSEVKANWCTWLRTKDVSYIQSDLSCDPVDDKVVIIRAIHASIVVDRNDKTDYFITVEKRLD